LTLLVFVWLNGWFMTKELRAQSLLLT